MRRPAVLLLMLGLALPSFAQSPKPPADQYAPLDESEWNVLLGDYRQLADCEDRYMTQAGINGAELGRRLAKQGKVAEIRDQTLKLLDPHSPWRKSLGAKDSTNPNVATQSLMALMMDGNQDGRTRVETMTRIGYARYYTSLATEGQCKAGDRFIGLLKKSAG